MRLQGLVAGSVLLAPVVAGPLDLHRALASLSKEQLESTRSAVVRNPTTATKLISPAIDEFIRESIALWDVRGVQVAVVRKRGDSDDFDVETRAYGVRNHKGEPMQTDTLLSIGSNTKAFTAAAVGLVVANTSNSVTWTTKLRDVFPEFEMKDPIATEYITLVDMLSHRSGLPRHDVAFSKDPDGFGSLQDIKHLRPSAEFRQVYQYNNHMYNIAGALLTRTTGIPFRDFLEEHLFDAMGMTKTQVYSEQLFTSGALGEGFWHAGVTINDTGRLCANRPYEGLDELLPGAGAVVSSSDDMAIWLQTLLNGGKSPKTGKQVIPVDVLAKISSGITVEASASGSMPELGPRTYGMGLEQSSYQGRQYVGHTGAILGYTSAVIRYPNDGLGIVVLTNDADALFHDVVKWRIAEEILGLPVRVDWNTRYKTAQRQGLEYLDKATRDRIPSPPDASRPSAPLGRLATKFSHPVYGRLAFKQRAQSTLYAETIGWGGYPASLTLNHFTANTFNATITQRIPVLGSRGKTEEQTISGLQVEFEVGRGAVVQGFGLWGGLWGAGAQAPPLKGESAREKAEVWFEREAWPWAEEADEEAQHVLHL